MKLCKKIALLRRENKLSQMELAGMLKLSRQAISRWETGDAMPSTENLKQLSRLYGVPVDVLLDEACTLEEWREEQRKDPAEESPAEESPAEESPAEEGPMEKSGKPLHKKGRAIAVTAAAAVLLAGIGVGILIGRTVLSPGEEDRELPIEDMEQEKVELDKDESFSFDWPK